MALAALKNTMCNAVRQRPLMPAGERSCLPLSHLKSAYCPREDQGVRCEPQEACRCSLSAPGVQQRQVDQGAVTDLKRAALGACGAERFDFLEGRRDRIHASQNGKTQLPAQHCRSVADQKDALEPQPEMTGGACSFVGGHQGQHLLQVRIESTFSPVEFPVGIKVDRSPLVEHLPAGLGRGQRERSSRLFHLAGHPLPFNQRVVSVL